MNPHRGGPTGHASAVFSPLTLLHVEALNLEDRRNSVVLCLALSVPMEASERALVPQNYRFGVSADSILASLHIQ